MDTGPVSGEVNAQSAEEVRIVTTVTRNDYRAYTRAVASTQVAWHKAIAKRRRESVWAAIGLAPVIVAAFVGGLALLRDGLSAHVEGMLIGGCVALLILVYQLQSRGHEHAVLRESMGRFAGKGKDSWVFTIVAGPRGLEVDYCGLRQHLPWEHVRSVSERFPGFVVIRAVNAMYLIPTRDLEPPASSRATLDAIHRWHRQSGFDELARVNALLKANPRPCARCRYTLESVGGLRCPECGWEFDLEDLSTTQHADPTVDDE